MSNTVYGSRCGGRVVDKAQGKAECFITQRYPTPIAQDHVRYDLCGLTVGLLVFHFPIASSASLIWLIPSHHLQSNWLISFKLTTHSDQEEGRTKQAAVAAVGKNAPLLA